MTSRIPRAAGCRRSGAGRGRPTGGCSTAGRRPTRRASRGRSARSTCGGTRTRRSGPGYDVPDFPADKPPGYRAPDDAEGMDAISGDDPFIMMADGRAWLYSPSGLLDGPMPTHYEPFESPVDNLLYPKMGANPVALTWDRAGEPGRAAGRRALPDRGLHLPPHRAPHGGRHEPQPALAGRAAARDVRGDRPAAGGGARDRERRVDDGEHRARRDRGPRRGDRPAAGR